MVLAVLNEHGYLPSMMEQIIKLHASGRIGGIEEIIFVDDGSTDGTLQFIGDMQKKDLPFEIKLVSRNRKMGTVDAQITGARMARGDYVCILDSDGQHPLSRLPAMVDEIVNGYDVVVGSRYVPGGSNGWGKRGIVSRGATMIAKIMFGRRVSIKDPLSGYFIARRDMIAKLEPIKDGYKLLLYTITQNRNAKTKEVPIVMRSRADGESKVVGGKSAFMQKYLREIRIYKKKMEK